MALTVMTVEQRIALEAHNTAQLSWEDGVQRWIVPNCITIRDNILTMIDMHMKYLLLLFVLQKETEANFCHTLEITSNLHCALG